MPELPDLQAFAKNLTSLFADQELQQIKIRNAAPLKDTEADLKAALEGKTLKKVYREGKELRYLFSNDVLLGMHLMLNGELHLYDKNSEHKNTIAEFHFNNSQGLVLTDWQARANIKLSPIDKAGIDALSAELNEAYLAKQCQRKKNIKALLTDQDIVRGIGNAYVDEILWEARISPFSVSRAIPLGKVGDIAKAIKKVLLHAIDQIQKTHPGIITGEVRDFLVIHNPKAKNSPTGYPIKVEKKSGGGTYYTDEQVLYE